MMCQIILTLIVAFIMEFTHLFVPFQVTPVFFVSVVTGADAKISLAWKSQTGKCYTFIFETRVAGNLASSSQLTSRKTKSNRHLVTRVWSRLKFACFHLEFLLTLRDLTYDKLGFGFATPSREAYKEKFYTAS